MAIIICTVGVFLWVQDYMIVSQNEKNAPMYIPQMNILWTKATIYTTFDRVDRCTHAQVFLSNSLIA